MNEEMKDLHVQIGLITAQLEILDYLAHKHGNDMSEALEVKIDWFRDGLNEARDELLKKCVKKRMVSIQSALAAFMS